MKKHFNRFLLVFLFLVSIFLFLPIFIVILMSFNASQYGTFPVHFTLKWYALLFSESELFPATWLSLSFSFLVAAAAVIIGTFAAIGMMGMGKKLRGIFSAVLTSAVIIPWLVLSSALLILFNAIGLGRSYTGMFLGNLTVVIPYVVLPVYGRMSETDLSPEDAARTLGASRLRVFWDVTLPCAFPAILSGGLLAFIVCFNNFVVQYYLAPFGVRTLPLEIYSMVRVGCKPDMNALASLIILFSVVLVVILYKLTSVQRLSRVRKKETETK